MKLVLYMKLVSNLFNLEQKLRKTKKFPSPIYGASFKLKKTSEVYSKVGLLFPSPIYGASFKPVSMVMCRMKISSFRPLYTGLVSN